MQKFQCMPTEKEHIRYEDIGVSTKLFKQWDADVVQLCSTKYILKHARETFNLLGKEYPYDFNKY